MLPWQVDAHRRPGSDSRRHLNGSVVIGDNPVNGRQTETRAALERAAERLEDRIDLVGGNPATLVLNGKYDFGACSRIALLMDRQAQTATALHRAKPVRREIPEDLTDLVLVRLVPDGRPRHVDVNAVRIAHLGAVAQERGRVLHDRTHIQTR